MALMVWCYPVLDGRHVGELHAPAVRGAGYEVTLHWHGLARAALQESTERSGQHCTNRKIMKHTLPASHPLPLFRSIQSKILSSGSPRVLRTLLNSSRRKS